VQHRSAPILSKDGLSSDTLNQKPRWRNGFLSMHIIIGLLNNQPWSSEQASLALKLVYELHNIRRGIHVPLLKNASPPHFEHDLPLISITNRFHRGFSEASLDTKSNYISYITTKQSNTMVRRCEGFLKGDPSHQLHHSLLYINL
jgi:hypothetical protein